MNLFLMKFPDTVSEIPQNKICLSKNLVWSENFNANSNRKYTRTIEN